MRVVEERDDRFQAEGQATRDETPVALERRLPVGPVARVVPLDLVVRHRHSEEPGAVGEGEGSGCVRQTDGSPAHGAATA